MSSEPENAAVAAIILTGRKWVHSGHDSRCWLLKPLVRVPACLTVPGSVPPRLHAGDRVLAAKPTQACNADQGYLVMERTAFGRKSNSAAQAWPNQATRESLPNASSRTESEAKISFVRHYHRSSQAPRFDKESHAITTFGYIASSPEIQATINTHKPRPAPRFRPTHF
jgi:hypothetical protein